MQWGGTVYTRTDTWFSSGGVRCAVAVYRPDSVEEACPTIVMGHGFGTPRAVALYVYADAFARAGYGVVVFDYKHFGESEGAISTRILSRCFPASSASSWTSSNSG